MQSAMLSRPSLLCRRDHMNRTLFLSIAAFQLSSKRSTHGLLPTGISSSLSSSFTSLLSLSPIHHHQQQHQVFGLARTSFATTVAKRGYAYIGHQYGNIPTSSWSVWWLRWVVGTIPLIVWIRDCGYSVCFVHGSSMEPTLHAGDVVLVRKCEGGTWTRSILQLFQPSTSSSSRSKSTLRSNVIDSESNNNNNNNSTERIHPVLDLSDDEIERARLIRYEMWQQQQQHPSQHYHPHLPTTSTPYASYARLYETSLVVLPGHIVIYKDPVAVSTLPQLCIKRVVGVGGQFVQPLETATISTFSDHVARDDETYDMDSTSSQTRKGLGRQHSIPNGRGNHHHWHHVQTNHHGTGSLRRHTSVPSQLIRVPYHTLFVEGDHHVSSQDSRHYGPLSKNAIVGVAEFIIWPPQRFQRVHRIPPTDSQGRSRAVW